MWSACEDEGVLAGFILKSEGCCVGSLKKRFGGVGHFADSVGDVANGLDGELGVTVADCCISPPSAGDLQGYSQRDDCR